MLPLTSACFQLSSTVRERAAKTAGSLRRSTVGVWNAGWGFVGRDEPASAVEKTEDIRCMKIAPRDNARHKRQKIYHLRQGSIKSLTIKAKTSSRRSRHLVPSRSCVRRCDMINTRQYETIRGGAKTKTRRAL